MFPRTVRTVRTRRLKFLWKGDVSINSFGGDVHSHQRLLVYFCIQTSLHLKLERAEPITHCRPKCRSHSIGNLVQGGHPKNSISEDTVTIWMKIDQYYQQRRCSPMTLVSGNIRLMRIFAGFPGEGTSNDSKVLENVWFQGFRTLHLCHLRKWGQHYYTILFSSLSPFHWPQNAWPRMTLKSWMAILR